MVTSGNDRRLFAALQIELVPAIVVCASVVQPPLAAAQTTPAIPPSVTTLERYALGTENKSLKYNDDGGLTLYLGNKSPGKERESNWLPAPAGNFAIWIRAYWPDRLSSRALGSRRSSRSGINVELRQPRPGP